MSVITHPVHHYLVLKMVYHLLLFDYHVTRMSAVVNNLSLVPD